MLMSCRMFLSRSGSSSSMVYCLPSISTRVKPSWRMCSSTSLCQPFWPRTTGALMTKRVSGSRPMI